MPESVLDTIDLRILDAVQEDGRLSNAELASRVGLSPSPCWRRLKRLEAEGYIRGYHAALDRRRLGFGVSVFVSVVVERHSTEEGNAFEEAVKRLPQVVACHSVSGQVDFILQVVAEDLDAYADFALNTLRSLPGIKEMHSSFALKEVKVSPRLPLPSR